MHTFDLFNAVEDSDGRRLLAMMADLPSALIRPLLAYLRLFKPVKQSLRWSRMVTILKELTPMITRAQVKRNGIDYAAPIDLWVSTINALVNNPPKTLKLPLKTNGYLLEIVAATVDKALAKTERSTEGQRRHRGNDNGALQHLGQVAAGSVERKPPPKSFLDMGSNKKNDRDESRGDEGQDSGNTETPSGSG